MKKIMLVAVAFSMMSMGFAADKKADAKTVKMGKQVTVAGIVTDPMCAKSGDKAKMMDSDCAKKCMKDGKMADYCKGKDGMKCDRKAGKDCGKGCCGSSKSEKPA